MSFQSVRLPGISSTRMACLLVCSISLPPPLLIVDDRLVPVDSTRTTMLMIWTGRICFDNVCWNINREDSSIEEGVGGASRFIHRHE